MNEDLAAWAREAAQSSEGAKGGEPAQGPCRYCPTTARTTCLRCAAAVCAKHHHVMYGLCTRCTEADGQPAAEAEAKRPDLGIPWFD